MTWAWTLWCEKIWSSYCHLKCHGVSSVSHGLDPVAIHHLRFLFFCNKKLKALSWYFYVFGGEFCRFYIVLRKWNYFSIYCCVWLKVLTLNSHWPNFAKSPQHTLLVLIEYHEEVEMLFNCVEEAEKYGFMNDWKIGSCIQCNKRLLNHWIDFMMGFCGHLCIHEQVLGKCRNRLYVECLRWLQTILKVVPYFVRF